MREILFRAKAINREPDREYRTNYKNGDWVYGLISGIYKYTEEMEMTNTDGISGIDVDPTTVCQFTGLTDKNGNKVFEGDIVKTDEYWCEIGVVKYGEGTFDSGIYRYTGFYYEDKDGYIDHNALYQPKENDDVGFVVIGNIIDNPELLE